MKVLYVDVDGTLTGPGGDLFYGNSTRVADALVRARVAGLTVVPVSGRGRLQVFELCRLLGLPRGIGELGCIAVEGREVRYQLGGYPFVGETPVEAMHQRGAIDAALALGLEPFDPWNEGRQATYLFRARPDFDLEAADRTLTGQGFGWCELVDNGRAVHLAPTGTGKPAGVRLDREHHGLAREETGFIGDSASDLACAPEVGECWLVANADWPASSEWPWRTTSPFGDGVAEVIDRALATSR